MADINLLPDDLRKKDEAEQKAAPKAAPTPFTWREPTLVKPTTPPPAASPKLVVPPLSIKSPSTPPLSPPPLREPVKPVSIPPPPVPKKPNGKPPLPPRSPSTPPAPTAPSFLQRLNALFHRTSKSSIPAEPRKEEVGASLGVNLLTEEMGGHRAALTPTTHIATVAAIALGAALTVIIGIWLVFKVVADGRMQRAQMLDAEVATLKRTVARLNTVMKENENFITRVRVVKQLLDAHVGTKNLFALLEQETVTTAQFSDVFVRPKDRFISLSMITLDVQSLVAQLVHWARLPSIEKVDVTSMARQERPEFVTPVYTVSVTMRVAPTIMQPWSATTTPSN